MALEGGGQGDGLSHPPKPLKKCTICKQEKSSAEFIKTAGGYRHSQCDPCRKAKLRDYNNKKPKVKLW